MARWQSYAPLLVCLLACQKPAATAASPTEPPSGEALGEAEALALATDAYVFGYPLVTMDVTRRVLTNVATPEGKNAPMEQFAHLREFPDASFKAVTAPNADTLYSTAWVDLADEPMVLSLPEATDRYYLMPILSAWTDVVASPGTRTTGTGPQAYLLTGPGWMGEVPEGLTRIEVPTDVAWILGRTYCDGTPKDYAAVHALQDEYRLVPLSGWGADYTPPVAAVDPDVDMETPPRDQVDDMDGAQFFARLAALMEENPPAEADRPMLEKLARLGIVPGQELDPDQLPEAVAAAVSKAPDEGLKRILGHAQDAGREVNGWTVTTDTGKYGTDYLQRAYVTYVGLGANLPEDAVYPTAKVDADGQPLTGANAYVLRFPAGQEPPVGGFWSVTMYTPELFFVENSLSRYAISPRDGLKRNPDGSTDLYIQSASPGKALESNWLPAPEGEFVLMMRLYAPDPSVIDGAWTPPAVERVRPPS